MAALEAVLSLMGALFLDRLLDGGDKWWTSVSFTASKTMDLGGVARQGLGGGGVLMDACREVVLFSTVVASMTVLAKLMRMYMLSRWIGE